jgi:hypothetical protein
MDKIARSLLEHLTEEQWEHAAKAAAILKWADEQTCSAVLQFFRWSRDLEPLVIVRGWRRYQTPLPSAVLDENLIWTAINSLTKMMGFEA